MEFRTIRMAPPNAEAGAPPLEGPVDLTPAEARALGSLVEKELATPDYYPMTLNALVAACNQKSSRNPVTDYSETEVQEALDGLKAKRLATRITASDGRVPRFRHLAYDAFRLTQAQGAVLAVLLLRGPQTTGEVRQRTQRLHEFESLAEVEETLDALANKTPYPLATRLPRRPGEKEARYAHLLAERTDEAAAEHSSLASVSSEGDGRLEALEAEVADLRRQLAELRAEVERFHGAQ